MRRALKSIDFYHAVPSELSEGTVSGACITIGTILTLTILLIAAIGEFTTPRTKSDMIVDQKHLDEQLKVNMDIQFPSYPCSMLSLDVENVLRVHLVNVGQTIKKFNLDDGSQYVDTEDQAELKKRIMDDLRSGKGCRMTGYFWIDRVPGNFHFSCHGYGHIVQQLLNDGSFRDLHKTLDLSHKINYVHFGELIPGMYSFKIDSFRGFESRKQIAEGFLGISYMYFLDIIESNYYGYGKDRTRPLYQYTVRMNEVVLATAPMLVFRYETSPITILRIQEYQEWHILFVKIVGIIGGVFTVATIIDSLVHSSIRFLIEKQRLGKLK